jgi:hypothetical protein
LNVSAAQQEISTIERRLSAPGFQPQRFFEAEGPF